MAKKKVESIEKEAPKKRGRKKVETATVANEVAANANIVEIVDEERVDVPVEEETVVKVAEDTVETDKKQESIDINTNNNDTVLEEKKEKGDNKKGNLFQSFRNFFGYIWNGQVVD